MSDSGAWASLGYVALILLAVGAVVMWGINIAKLVGASAFGLLEAIRAAGIVFPPIGVVMGFV